MSYFADTMAHASRRAPLLDADAYHSLAFAKIEDETVWTREWVCIGVNDDAPGVGDLLPFTAGDHAVHIQRLASGRLVGRFNLAQHGGCRVVPLQCRQGAKTSCSFTSCGHSRDRLPMAADETRAPSPEMYQYLGLRPERLLGVRVATSGVLLFVHLDPAGRVFKAHATLAFSSSSPHRHAQDWVELDGNWKHVGQRIATGALQPGDADRCASFSDNGAAVHASWFFPNLIVLRDASSTCVIVLQPVALQRTVCRISVYGADSIERWHALLAQRCSQRFSRADTSDSRHWFEALLDARIANHTEHSFNGYDT